MARRGLYVVVALAVAAVGIAVAGVALLKREPAQAGPIEGARGQPGATPSALASQLPAAAPSADKPARVAPKRPDDELPPTLEQQRARLYAQMQSELRLSEAALEKVRAIIEPSPVVGQGNPKISKHKMTRSECWDIRERAGLHAPKHLEALAKQEKQCGARNMSPIGRGDQDTTVCIDQYEFPNVPCEYPVVYPSAKQAADLCAAVGKRLCDAHEWEGACAGKLLPAEKEYLWDRPRRIEMEYFKNQDREIVWAYGSKMDQSKCATGASKSSTCDGGGWETCGSNTFPAGAFPECVSSFGVYDQHGNAAEHMNLPMKPEELSSRGGLGETEMKGSWFIFKREPSHKDDCRWRAPSWHVGRVASVTSHANYHLGFRCCKSVGAGK